MKPEDLGALFSTFKRSAFRLETLSVYSVDEDDEREAFRLFLGGKPQPSWSRDRGWPKFVSSACAAGKIMQRVRVLSFPLTDYLRFELSCGYPANVAAGEDIRILPIVGDVPPGIVDHDYWLFDDEIVVRMEYDEAGRFVRPVAVDDQASYLRCREVAMARAVPFSEYLLTHAQS
jgi:hypothetical protein